MNKKIVLPSTLIALLTIPAIGLAVTLIPLPSAATDASVGPTSIIIAILNFIWPIFAGFAVIMLIVAGFNFLTSRGEPAKVESTRQAILWAVVGIIVALLAFSIPWVIKNSLGV